MSYYDSTNIPTPASTYHETHRSRNGLRNAFIAGAGLSGMVVGVAASLGVVVPMMHTASSQNRVLRDELTTMVPADSINPADVCAAPSVAPVGGQGAGQVLGASVVAPVGGQGAGVVPTPPSGGAGGGGAGGGGSQTFVQNLVSGQVAKNEATISNTGPNSTNQVTETNTITTNITNTNNISASNTNTQTSTSGSATVNNNTNAGSAVSGNATNTNSTSLNISVKNQ